MPDAPKPAQRNRAPTIALIVAGIVAVIALGIALTRGHDATPPGNVAMGNASAASTGADANQVALRRIDELRAAIARDPDNPRSWYQLGSLYRDFEQFPDALTAFRRAMQLQPNNPDYLAATGEAILLSGRPGTEREAKPLFEKALTVRPDHPRSRYFMAVLKDLGGDHRGGIEDMIALVRSAPPSAPWLPGVRNTLNDMAANAHIDITSRLPPAPPQAPATAAIPGPTREQMDAARGIPPSQQDEMVNGMVARLAARLQGSPRDEEGWMRLMRSYTVLNRHDDAAAALRSALAAFTDDAAAQARLRAAAASLGIAGG